MGFTLRFLLGFILVLSICLTVKSASSWRYIRQISPVDQIPEVPLSEEVEEDSNESTAKDILKNATNTITNNTNTKVEIDRAKKVDLNQYEAEKKSKTETSAEKYSKDNKVGVNRTKVNKEAHKIEINLEKPLGKNLNSSEISEELKASTDNSRETKETTTDSRAESARSLDIDINKYISDDFHNKNNVYTFSESPDTEKYSNLYNDLPKSTTSRLYSQETSVSAFGNEPSTSLEKNLTKKFLNIQQGVKQKLEYIDREFAEAEENFRKSQTDEPSIDKILENPKDNDTEVNLNYSKYRNISENYNKHRNKIRKELDMEVGENVDYSSSYNKTRIIDELPKDYKNKIPTNDDALPEVSDSIYKSQAKLAAYKTTVVPDENKSNQDRPLENYHLKNNTSVNNTDNHKSLLSNNIETDITGLSENNGKLQWDLPYSSTTSPMVVTATSTGSTSGSIHIEEHVYVPFDKENAINVSKRGSTKYSNTLKTIGTTETAFKNMTNSISTNKISNKPSPNKENNTDEQAVLENQVVPVLIPPPNNDLGDTNVSNVTTENTSIESTENLSTIASATIENFATENSIATEEMTDNVFDTVTTTVSIDSTALIENLSTVSDWETTDGTTEPYTTFSTIPTYSPTEYPDSTTVQTTETLTTTVSTENTSNGDSASENYTIDVEATVTSPDNKTDEFGNDAKVVHNGRDPKSYYNETDSKSTNSNYVTTPDTPNNFDISASSTTSEDNQETVTTTQEVPVKTTPSQTTVDYRDNVIIKNLSEFLGATKQFVEITTEFVRVADTTKIVDEKENPFEETGGADREYSTLDSYLTQPKPDEPTTFIIPLNISMLEIDGTDSSTVSGNLGLEDPDDKIENNGGPIAAIVISCIGAACLIILAGLLFLMRKRHKRFNYGQRCTPVSLDAYSVDNVSAYNSLRRKGASRASKRSYGNPAFDDPTTPTHPLNFPSLAKFVGNHEEIASEFEEIPQVTAQTSELPEGCETKNRYANVIPLPETRVFLNAIEGYPNSDYINANFVTGPKNSRGYYIACQAPMQNTVDDFWRMVWEQQSKVVVMLTHLYENGNEKCTDYLPPSEVLDCHRLFGDFQVSLKKREVKEKYVISSLQLKNMVSNSWREITHLWYLGWPEKGVPSEANSLIAFLIEARSYIKSSASSENGKSRDGSNVDVNNGTINPEQGPMIVHCSPGTGRTGTVIACDIAIREFELMRQVDIPKTVYRIRRNRASSVQTKEQYEFIYKVICLYATKLTGGVLDSL